MTRAFTAFLRDESGATAIEYSMIAAVVFIAIISSLAIMGDSVNTTFVVLGEVWDS